MSGVRRGEKLGQNYQLGRIQTLGEIPPTPALRAADARVKGGSESLKVPFDKGDLGGSARIYNTVPQLLDTPYQLSIINCLLSPKFLSPVT